MKTNIERQAFGTAIFLALASLPAWAGNASGSIGNLPDILIG